LCTFIICFKSSVPETVSLQSAGIVSEFILGFQLLAQYRTLRNAEAK
jgi:hypothetical protein